MGTGSITSNLIYIFPDDGDCPVSEIFLNKNRTIGISQKVHNYINFLMRFTEIIGACEI
jgi:hypothetical protein